MPFISTRNCPEMAKNSCFQPRKFTARIPVTAINFKSGSHARLQFHGERGCFSVEGMVHDFQKKGVFSGYSLHGFKKKAGVFQKATSMDYRGVKSQTMDYHLIKVKIFGATRQRLSYDKCHEKIDLFGVQNIVILELSW